MAGISTAPQDRERASVRDAARQTGKMSNKREKPLTAALRALCGQAGEGREKQSEQSAETFCFSGFRLSVNLLGRWRTFGRFVGNGLDRSVRLNRIVRSIGKWRAIRRDFMRCAQPAVRMGQDPSLHYYPKKGFPGQNHPRQPKLPGVVFSKNQP